MHISWEMAVLSYNGNTYTGKTTYLYQDPPWFFYNTVRPVHNALGDTFHVSEFNIYHEHVICMVRLISNADWVCLDIRSVFHHSLGMWNFANVCNMNKWLKFVIRLDMDTVLQHIPSLSFTVTSLRLEQSYDCPNTSDTNLQNKGK